MKKIWLVMTALFMMGSTVFAAETEIMEPKEGEHSDILIAYVSRAGENYNVGVKDPDSESAAYAGYIEKGNTQIVAEYIAEMTGGDLYAITTEDPYPEDYQSMLARAQEELDQDARPLLAGELPEIDGYQTIYIGYPIWHGAIPRPVLTFLDSLDFTGKTIIPFNTHEGSGQSGTVEEIREEVGDVKDVTIEDGIAIQGKTAQENEKETRDKLEQWLADMGLFLN
ncbi:MAG: flavodoxin [Lachnospiraceae bacterium]|nr:flavodoxin [Lachnospiraceae bacterium]